jgi:hypothetical protein
VVVPYGRNTIRLVELLTAIGFALGGEAGKRMSQQVGCSTSGDALLSQIRATPSPAFVAPRVLGVDDFSFLRGQVFHASHNLAKTVLEFSVCILRAPLRQRYRVALKRAALHQDAGRESGRPQEGANIQ